MSARGACSLVVMALDARRGTLHVASLGNCGYVVLRPNEQVAEMEPISMWRPYTDTSAKLKWVLASLTPPRPFVLNSPPPLY